MPEHYQPQYVLTPFWASADSWAVCPKATSNFENSLPDYVSMQYSPLGK